MAERERRLAPPFGGTYVARSQVLDAEAIQRALTRIAHEIIERNSGTDELLVIGLQTGGVPLADRVAELLEEFGDAEVPVGRLDVALYRDDITLRPVLPEAVTEIPVDVDLDVYSTVVIWCVRFGVAFNAADLA